MKLHTREAFTLVEVLIYSALLVVVSTLLVSILGIVARIGNTTSSASEVAAQANFILQNIGRMVSASSAVDVDAAGQTTLKIYNKDYGTVPTTVTFSGGNVVVTDTTGSAPLNTSKVVVNSLVFRRMINPGGFDTVGVDLTLSFNTSNPQQMLTRSLSTAISRANAATFDGGLFPSGVGGADVGAIGTQWANGFFSGNVSLGGNLILSNTSSVYSTNWTNVVFGSGWSNYGGGYQVVQYKKVGDLVFIRGLASSASWAGQPTIFTLPVNFRPLATSIFNQNVNSNVAARIDISANGDVRWIAGGAGTSWVSLSGVVFSTD